MLKPHVVYPTGFRSCSAGRVHVRVGTEAVIECGRGKQAYQIIRDFKICDALTHMPSFSHRLYFRRLKQHRFCSLLHSPEVSYGK